MKIEFGKHIAIQYTLTGYEAPENPEEDIEMEEIEETHPDRPFQFIFGVGQLLPAFEKNIEGMEEGGKFDFTLSPSEAYGEYDDEKVIALPKSMFSDDKGNFLSKFVMEGGEVPLQNQNGDIIQATVQKITDKEVICDVNHPLAGMTLHFVGTIQEVRETTEEDKLAYMRQMTGHVEGGCGGCGGGSCDSCGEGGCGHGEGDCNCGHGEEGCCGHGEGKGNCGHGEGKGNCGHHGHGEGGCKNGHNKK